MQKLTPRNNQNTRNKSKSNRSISPNFSCHFQKNKENIHVQKNVAKQQHENPANQSIKICLQLASHHKKQAQDFKLKNEVLEYRLNDQLISMESLKKQLNQIHIEMQNGQKKYKKEMEELKSKNQKLTKEVQGLTQQNNNLKSQIKETQSIFTDGQMRSQPEISLLTLAKDSRRQKYTTHYEHINFIPSVVCLSCKQQQSQIQAQRQIHCKQLMKFQQQLSILHKKQESIDKNQEQMTQKNECISFLFNQLDKYEQNAEMFLDTIDQLQKKICQLAANDKKPFRKNVSQNYLSYSCSNPLG